MHVGSSKPVLNRMWGPEGIRNRNGEQPIHPLYRYALVADSEEGLVLVDIDTLTDGDPENNKLTRAVTFNPQNHLTGARMVRTTGRYAYVVSDQNGLAVVDLNQPLSPRLVYRSPPGELRGARALEIQLRYAFVVDRDGLKVFDVTNRERPRVVPDAFVGLEDGRGVFLFRTYALVAAGRNGLMIVDIQNPERPAVVNYERSGLPLDDTYDVAVGATNVSFFAYVADGRNGLRVVRLVEPPETPGHLGFAPMPVPKLIATFPTSGTAVAVARGQVRDRFVDESGNQAVVSNRIGSRTFNLEEIRRFLYYPDGELMRLSNDVPEPLQPERVTPATAVLRDGTEIEGQAGGGRP
jgi:hypothetical protein